MKNYVQKGETLTLTAPYAVSSAGGALVAALLSRADTRALVCGGIIQSGPLLASSPARGGRVTRQLAARLGVPATAEAFTALAPDALLEARHAQSAGSSPLGGAPGFALVIDEETLPSSPHEALRASFSNSCRISPCAASRSSPEAATMRATGSCSPGFFTAWEPQRESSAFATRSGFRETPSPISASWSEWAFLFRFGVKPRTLTPNGGPSPRARP